MLYLRSRAGLQSGTINGTQSDQRVEAQQERLLHVSNQRGWRVVGVYADYATSNRARWPQFDALRPDARSGKFEVVVVHNLGRMTRCLSDPLETLCEFDRLGIALVAVEDGLDTTDARTRDTVRGLVAALLRAERTVRSERSTAALAAARENGTKSGCPAGRPRREIDRDRIRQLRAQGRSLSKIAAEMGVSASLVRRECAVVQENADPVPVSAGIPTADLSAAASLPPIAPAPATVTSPSRRGRKAPPTSAGIAYGNAPYQRPLGQQGRRP